MVKKDNKKGVAIVISYDDKLNEVQKIGSELPVEKGYHPVSDELPAPQAFEATVHEAARASGDLETLRDQIVEVVEQGTLEQTLHCLNKARETAREQATEVELGDEESANAYQANVAIEARENTLDAKDLSSVVGYTGNGQFKDAIESQRGYLARKKASGKSTNYDSGSTTECKDLTNVTSELTEGETYLAGLAAAQKSQEVIDELAEKVKKDIVEYGNKAIEEAMDPLKEVSREDLMVDGKIDPAKIAELYQETNQAMQTGLDVAQVTSKVLEGDYKGAVESLKPKQLKDSTE